MTVCAIRQTKFTALRKADQQAHINRAMRGSRHLWHGHICAYPRRGARPSHQRERFRLLSISSNSSRAHSWINDYLVLRRNRTSEASKQQPYTKQAFSLALPILDWEEGGER